ncbi:MAG: IS110 family transposase [Cytophagales bacterium]|nr:IS110 family transposase [Cytophagales bacterium]MDW3197079.1 IS110 family transposase [Cytophagales bacterium]
MKKGLNVIHQHAAGIDIGSREFFVDAGEEQVKIFPTYTQGCHALKDYLISRRIQTVAMESTGVYWIILYSILEEAGIEVYLVNGRDVRNVPGRKSDVKDCQWLRQLHSYGLLRKSFVPTGDFRVLRTYMRVRRDNIQSSASQVHLMQKALTLMNVRLTEAINDITGASGLRMVEKILDGETDPEKLVELCEASILNKKRDLVVKALEGEYREEHLFALRQAYRSWKHYNELIHECDKEVEKLLQEITSQIPDVEIKGKRKPIRYHKPDIKDLHQPLLKLTQGKDPTTIAGITDYSFLQIVSEIGVDMSAWKTEKHFVSWLKLAPQKNSSGKSNRRHKVKRHNKASYLFRNVAQGILTSKHLALGSFGRRIRAKRGGGVAIKAIARKIACYYYRVMTKGEAFVEQGIQAYEDALIAKQKRYLEKLAFQHNMVLVPADPDLCP